MVETQEQKSLIVYLESRCVDATGRVDLRHMNANDVAQAVAWSKVGFIEFGRITAKDVTGSGGAWVRFTEAAWCAAHRERRARAQRGIACRTWETTQEQRAASAAGVEA